MSERATAYAVSAYGHYPTGVLCQMAIFNQHTIDNPGRETEPGMSRADVLAFAESSLRDIRQVLRLRETTPSQACDADSVRVG